MLPRTQITSNPRQMERTETKDTKPITDALTQTSGDQAQEHTLAKIRQRLKKRNTKKTLIICSTIRQYKKILLLARKTPPRTVER